MRVERAGDGEGDDGDEDKYEDEDADDDDDFDDGVMMVTLCLLSALHRGSKQTQKISLLTFYFMVSHHLFCEAIRSHVL